MTCVANYSKMSASFKHPPSHHLWQWLQTLSRRAEPGNDGVIRLAGKQIYILPTSFGITYTVLLLAMLFGANNYGSNPAFLLTFLLAGLGMAALFQTWKNLLGLEIVTVTNIPVFCASEAEFNFIVHNPFPSPRPGIWINAHGLKGASGSAADLPGDSNHSLSISCATNRRGLMKIGRIKIETRYPLGLFRAWAYADCPGSCLVYPQPAPIGGGFDRLAGREESQQKKIEGMDDFAGHKPYQQGDNVMHIDWKVVARGKGWQLKDFDAKAGTIQWLNWDQLQQEDIETRLSLLAKAVIELDQQQATYGLQLPGVTIDPDHGASHRDQCLKALALFGF